MASKDLPPPDWLTLPEVLEFLDSYSIEADGGVKALERAFHDKRIRTRGRSKEWHGHDTKKDLLAVAWDQPQADWQSSTLKKQNRWGEYEITEIDVSRIGLIRWLGVDEGAGRHDDAATVSTEVVGETRGRRLASESRGQEVYDRFNNLVAEGTLTFERGELTRVAGGIASATGYAPESVRRMLGSPYKNARTNWERRKKRGNSQTSG